MSDITYNQCVELCNYSDSPFYETKVVVEGFDVSVFNYRLAQWKDFSKPFGEDCYIKGYELRGITFVFNKDGSQFKRYLLLHKFFNLNQVPETLYSEVKDLGVKYVNNKEDGSLATFIKLPNGKVVGKSKLGFDNDQANGINKIYNKNSDIQNFVNECLSKDIIPIFEYVAPTNRIVLRYNNEKLILLKLRDNITGEYLDISDAPVEITEFEKMTLDTIINLASIVENKEGWVIEFDNGMFIKVKTEWYRNLHGLLTEDLYHENVLIKHILDDNIDDIIGNIPEGEVESLERIDKLISIIKREVNSEYKRLSNEYDKVKQLSKREYVSTVEKRTKDFSIINKLFDRDSLLKMNKDEIFETFKTYDKYENALEIRELHNIIITEIRKETNRLEKAREWLEKRGYKL